MNKLKLTLLTTICLSMVSCAVPYRQQSYWNPVGYTEKQLSSDTVTISYSINPFRKIETADDLAFKRAIETTRAHGYQYFNIISKVHTEAYHEQGIGGAPVEMPYPTTTLIIRMTHKDTGTSISVN